MEALENVVSIQEQQLLDMTAQREQQKPEVAAMLPRWRQETLRQYELRLRAQLAVKQATESFQKLRKDLEEKVRSSEASREVRLLL